MNISCFLCFCLSHICRCYIMLEASWADEKKQLERWVITTFKSLISVLLDSLINYFLTNNTPFGLILFGLMCDFHPPLRVHLSEKGSFNYFARNIVPWGQRSIMPIFLAVIHQVTYSIWHVNLPASETNTEQCGWLVISSNVLFSSVCHYVL